MRQSYPWPIYGHNKWNKNEFWMYKQNEEDGRKKFTCSEYVKLIIWINKLNKMRAASTEISLNLTSVKWNDYWFNAKIWLALKNSQIKLILFYLVYTVINWQFW